MSTDLTITQQTSVNSHVPRVGVGVIVEREGKILIGRRKSTLGKGCWAFPGGHLEYGESIQECAARELLEETGMTALSIFEGPWTNDLIDANKHYITIFAIVDQADGVPQLLEPDKCDGWHWVDWDELPEPLFPSIRSLIAKIGIDNLSQMSRTRKLVMNGVKSGDGAQKIFRIRYTNYRGETSARTISPQHFWYGHTEYHPHEQFFIRATDCERNVQRDFALKDISEWAEVENSGVL